MHMLITKTRLKARIETK